MQAADSWEKLSDALLGPFERDIINGLTGAYRAMEPRIEQAFKRSLDGGSAMPLQRLLILRQQLGQELSALRLPPELAQTVNQALLDGQVSSDFWALAELNKVKQEASKLTPEQAAQVFANATTDADLLLGPGMAQQNPTALIAAAQRQNALANYAAGARGTQAFATLNRLVDVDLRGRIIGAVEFHLASGDSWRQLRKTLQNSVELSKSRAQTVARTEMAAAMVEGTKLRYEAEGIEQVQWQAVGSSRTCGYCAPRHGKVYQLGDVVAPAHPNCVLADSLVTTGTVIAATRAWYRGNLVAIGTRNGEVTVTANHPMATQRGWVKAMDLRQGDYLIRHLSGIPGSGIDLPHLKQTPARAEDVFNALLASSPVPPITVPSASVQFHGDGAAINGQVDVVFANRQLQAGCQPFAAQDPLKLNLISGDTELSMEPCLSSFDAALLAVNAASCGLIGFARELFASFRRELVHAELLSLSSAANSYPELLEPPSDDIPAAAQLLRECFDAGAGVVELDEVLLVQIKTLHEAIPVYDFTTVSSAYIVDNCVTHNCRCTVTPWDPEWEELGLIDPQEEAQSRAAVLADLEAAGKQPISGPTPFEKALGMQQAPEPLWTPPRPTAGAT